MFLSQDKILEIEAKASTILEAVFPAVPLPVDLDKILKYYSIKLAVGSFKDDSIAGVFERSSQTIYISQFAAYPRNAFTIAHELGHFFLHIDKPAEVFYRLDADLINSPERDPMEAEANWFAASLLMPKSKVVEFDKVFHGDLDKMAVVFGVSKTAMYWRYRNLRSSNIA